MSVSCKRKSRSEKMLHEYKVSKIDIRESIKRVRKRNRVKRKVIIDPRQALKGQIITHM